MLAVARTPLSALLRRQMASFGGGGGPVGSRAGNASALKLLGLRSGYSARELRDSYFAAARNCHPDSSPDESGDTDLFLKLTEAYDQLRIGVAKNKDLLDSRQGLYDTPTEAEDYRTACMSWLGLPAEIVEESKACPMFREYLMGNTDGAQYWRSFLALNGGLAPRLQLHLTC